MSETTTSSTSLDWIMEENPKATIEFWFALSSTGSIVPQHCGVQQADGRLWEADRI